MRSIEKLRPVRYDDLTGFKFGDYHSSQFGLIRVSNGSRYNEYLLPTLKNTTTDVPGIEGTLYFGTQKTTRSFQVDMAFDSLIPALQSNTIDFIAAGMSVTEERKKNVDFSVPYFQSEQVIIVKK